MARENQRNVLACDANKTGVYCCPECKERVIFKCGSYNAPYFAHYRGSTCLNSVGESYQHNLGKLILYKSFRCGKNVNLESYLPAIQQRADLLVNKTAWEYQCSPISLRRLKERVAGYKKMGIKSFWILGMKYFHVYPGSSSLLKFLRYHTTIGYYLPFLDAQKGIFYLRYRICQVDGKYVFKQHSFRSLKSLLEFMSTSHGAKFPLPSLLNLTNRIENKLRFGDANFLRIQEICYKNGHLLQGCPLICHRFRVLPPLFSKNWLSWSVMLMLNDGSTPDFKDGFVFLSNPTYTRNEIFKKFRMEMRSASKEECSWFRDSYDKMSSIKKISNWGEKYDRDSWPS